MKKGLLCQLFAGTKKDKAASTKGQCREQLHILLCGDPSTAKSQLMTAVNKLSARGVIASGKGSSATGTYYSVLLTTVEEFFDFYLRIVDDFFARFIKEHDTL